MSAGGRGGAPLGHFTRTLAAYNSTMYISIGSLDNVDPDSSRARVRYMDLNAPIPAGGVAFDNLPVWADGLRNGVAMAFDAQGRLWEADNGPDNLQRSDLGVDVFNDNPAEEINLLDGPAGTFYGYPQCFSAYKLDNYPKGTQFAWPPANITQPRDDAWCRNTTNNKPPVGYLPSHSSPIGASFFNKGQGCASQEASLPCEWENDFFVTLHGSWNSNVPKGFQLVRVPMKNNVPQDPITLFAAKDFEQVCKGTFATTSCFRPAGVAFDKQGTLWVSSDSTGDIVQFTRLTAADSQGGALGLTSLSIVTFVTFMLNLLF